MALTLPEQQNLLLNTEAYPDKIVYRLETTQSVPLAPGLTAYTEYTFAHGLPFIPLIMGTYSADDFVTSYDFGVGPYELLPTYGFWSYSLQAHAWADATNVKIRVISHNTARTVKFKLIGLLPGISASAAIQLPAPPIQDNLLFDSDLNYMKHAFWFNIDMTTNGLGTYVHRTFATNINTPLTPLCFLIEDGKVSYMNTMNTITTSGVTLLALPGNNTLQISVSDTIVKTVSIIVKAYLDA